MSTLVVLKENNVLILGTDSRLTKHDGSGIASDSEKKIHEIAPEVFIAASGWKFATNFEHAKARELAARSGTADIRILSEVLRREFIPYLTELTESSRLVEGLHTYSGYAVCGEAPVHASVLAGRDAHGQLGWIIQEYSLRDGGIAVESSEYFGDNRQFWARPGEPVVNVAQERGTWTDHPSVVVRRLLATQRAANSLIGGPDQIVQLDCGGAHWLSKLPTAEVNSSVDGERGLTHATVNVGGPGFTFNGAGGILIAGGGSVNVLSGKVTGGTIGAGTGGYELLGTQVIDGNGAFTGTGVSVSGGCGANGFNPKVGGIQYYGATFSFRDLDGNTHQVKGGVIVS